MTDASEIIFHGPNSLISEVEKHFELNLVDETAFFSPSGKAGEIYEIPVLSDSSDIDRLYLVGVGDSSLQALRQAGAAIGRKVRGKALNVVSLIPSDSMQARTHAISMVLGAYTWNLKTTPASEFPTFSICTKDDEAINEAASIAQALVFARDLIHTPSNIKNPAWIAERAQDLAKEKGLTVQVKAGAELAEFGGLRAVGNSSPQPGPRFIEVSYIPQKLAKSKIKAAKALPHVVLVGKGITYDTGGVSLKRPYDLMAPMKSDMAGTAAALATMSAIADLQPNIRVTALLMCAENALSSTSQRPSDVITQYGGTTVEIINTDAEGRLVLADGIAYADKNLDPDYIVDIATLTGAITLGLGRQYAGLYTRDAKLAKSMMAIGENCGERVWHMPLIDDYADALESEIADLNHTADKYAYSAGSVTAALYLENFAGDRKWVHIDIAGTGRSDSDSGENPKGGTGFGVRLLTDWILSLS